MPPKLKNEKPIKFDDLAELDGKVKGLFEAFYQDKAKEINERFVEQDKARSNIIIGVVAGAIFIVLGAVATLIWDNHLNTAEYNKGLLEARDSFNQQIGNLREQNYELQLDLTKKADEAVQKSEKIEEKLDYLNNLFLEQNRD